MAGRGVHRGVYSSLLDHPDFQALSSSARHVFLTLRISKQAGPAAIFICYRGVVAAQTGLPIPTVERCLGELEQAGWLRTEGRIVWIVNGLRHDPTMRMGNAKHRAAVRRALEELPRLKIVLMYCEYYNLEWLSIAMPKLDRVGPPNTEYRIPNTDLAPLVDNSEVPEVENPDAGVTPPPETPEDQRAQIKREVAKLSKRLGWR